MLKHIFILFLMYSSVSLAATSQKEANYLPTLRDCSSVEKIIVRARRASPSSIAQAFVGVMSMKCDLDSYSAMFYQPSMERMKASSKALVQNVNQAVVEAILLTELNAFTKDQWKVEQIAGDFVYTVMLPEPIKYSDVYGSFMAPSALDSHIMSEFQITVSPEQDGTWGVSGHSLIGQAPE
tara:strand:+ start:40180 stop:40722 length:543 start_codon:yes stop_codon:yes gene_type:complete